MTFQEKKKACYILILVLVVLALIPIVSLGKKQPQGEYITTGEVRALTELAAVVTGFYDEVYGQETTDGTGNDAYGWETTDGTGNDAYGQETTDRTGNDAGISEGISTEPENDGLESGDGENVLESDKKIGDSKEPGEAEKMEAIRDMKNVSENWEDGDLTYKQFLEWYVLASQAFGGMAKGEEQAFDKKYKDGFFVLKEDWYFYFDKLSQNIDPQGQIQKQELILLGDASNVIDIEGNPIEQNLLFSHDGLWEKKLPSTENLMQKTGQYIIFQNAIWGVVGTEDEAGLNNVWIVENTEEELSYFYNNHEVLIAKDDVDYEEKERVADIRFEQGKLDKVHGKAERVTGELLKISADEVEIEGVGTYPLSEEARYYRLYDNLESIGRNEMRIGYSFADFVIEDGVVQAGLLVKDEKMENIRVLVKNSNFGGYYHEEIVCVSDVDMELIYGDNVLLIPAGETLQLDTGSEYFSQSRIYLKPAALTGRTVFSSVERNQSGQGYRGSFELEKREEGIVLINEVLLEEYLYAVVPSEMPGYYPMEALKAQAVSARTYAYDKMEYSSLSSWGAHLDDSSTFQVYNNIKENANTTKAVKETRGQLLYSGEGLAETYYYSTSCGFGTNADIWSSEGAVKFPYLQAKEMTTGEVFYTSEGLRNEESFRAYIDNVTPSHFEAEEAWYRWEYAHQNMGRIAENLKTRQEKDAANVLFSADGEHFESMPLKADMEIQDIQVRSRGAGGTVEELLFITDKGQVLVRKELNVRSVLADGEAKVLLQDHNTYSCKNLLPSAFFYITVEKEGNQAASLKLNGGGFGHGVGMSQNGAKNLANLGKSAEEILAFYYEGCTVQKVYE